MAPADRVESLLTGEAVGTLDGMPDGREVGEYLLTNIWINKVVVYMKLCVILTMAGRMALCSGQGMVLG